MSFIEVTSYQQQGLDKKEILVQGIKTRGISQLSLSGHLSSSLRDSRDKIKAVTARITPWGPVDKILLNLLPADQSKFSPQLEVPMALATLALLWPQDLDSEQITRIHSFTWAGSLSLSGAFHDFELVDKNSQQKICSFSNISEAWNFILTGEVPLIENTPKRSYMAQEKISAQERDHEKFWLQIAADARLPAMLIGPPGVGKSHLAKWALSCIRPPSAEDREKVDQIWTLAGKEEIPLIPLQAPHSRTHLSEFVGIARHEIPRPGIFSLAHGGLLILDEFPELARDSREILRNVLDEKKIVKNTKAGFCSWPADFWLILTANPCPCGYAQGNDLSACRCQESVRQKYISRFSGPLLDRIGVKLFLRRSQQNKDTAKLGEIDLSKKIPDFYSSESLSEREKNLFSKLWCAYWKRVEWNENNQRIFQEFLQDQRNFGKEWFVHAYT